MNIVSSMLAGLLLASVATASVLPRQDDASLSSVIAAAASSASLGPYAKPTQAISKILAIGDSYTAGVGSNGLPDRIEGSYSCSRYTQAWPLQLAGSGDWPQFNGDTRPDVTFGACTGAKMDDLLQHQLNQGDPNPNLEYTNIGKPQIAVMTITGNDVEFSNAINDCVLRGWLPGDCDETLTRISNKIDSQDFKNKLIDTLIHVMAAGRQAGGATPPEAFQIYIAGYVGFWNHDNPACDEVSFGYWWFSKPKLTRDLRKRMNDLVDKLNGVISSIASQMSGLGVVYVDGFQSAYDKHRFCEPPDGPDYLVEPIGKKTWFWHHLSPNLIGGGEGPDGASTDGLDNRTQEILDYLIPDKGQQATISEANPPWNLEQFSSEEAFYDALDKAIGDNNDVRVNLDEGTRRIFHPKGSGYTPYAEAFLGVIRANREPVGAASSSPTPTPSPAPAQPAPYATGTCSFHLNEYELPCTTDTKDLSAEIVLKDGAGAEIGNTGGSKGINDGASLSLDSKLPSPLVVTGEHRGDYVQFTYRDLSWTNTEPKKDGDTTLAYCNSGGWDPREGPSCGRITRSSKRQMDCYFRC